MRKMVLIGVVCFCTSLCAQSYIPLLDTTASWQDENGWASPGPNTSSHHCIRYFLSGDSVVGGMCYFILRRTGSSRYDNNVFPGQSYTDWYSGEYVALLREDTSSRKVWIRPAGWSSELLFYDFSVGVGAYPNTYRYQSQWPNDLEVTSVDTIWLTDGPHRRWVFWDTEEVIEGVGGTSSFMYVGGGEMHYPARLVCHALESTPNYSVASLNCPCGSSVSVAERIQSSLRIGPTLTSDECHLAGAPANARYRLLSLDGRMVTSGVCSGNGSTTVNLTNLPASVYLLEVEDRKQWTTWRVIKE